MATIPSRPNTSSTFIKLTAQDTPTPLPSPRPQHIRRPSTPVRERILKTYNETYPTSLPPQRRAASPRAKGLITQLSLDFADLPPPSIPGTANTTPRKEKTTGTPESEYKSLLSTIHSEASPPQTNSLPSTPDSQLDKAFPAPPINSACTTPRSPVYPGRNVEGWESPFQSDAEIAKVRKERTGKSQSRLTLPASLWQSVYTLPRTMNSYDSTSDGDGGSSVGAERVRSSGGSSIRRGIGCIEEAVRRVWGFFAGQAVLGMVGKREGGGFEDLGGRVRWRRLKGGRKTSEMLDGRERDNGRGLAGVLMQRLEEVQKVREGNVDESKKDMGQPRPALVGDEEVRSAKEIEIISNAVEKGSQGQLTNPTILVTPPPEDNTQPSIISPLSPPNCTQPTPTVVFFNDLVNIEPDKPLRPRSPPPPPPSPPQPMAILNLKPSVSEHSLRNYEDPLKDWLYTEALLNQSAVSLHNPPPIPTRKSSLRFKELGFGG